jgi:hypothetical protein
MRIGMINGEMLFIATFRAVLGLAMAAVTAFLGWLMLRLLFPVADYSSTLFMAIAAMLVGGFGGIGAMAAWWSTEHPRSVRLLCITLTIIAASLSSWIGLQLVRNNIHFAWISGIGSVPVIYQRDAFTAAVGSAIIGANVVAGTFYLLRSFLRKEL